MEIYPDTSEKCTRLSRYLSHGVTEKQVVLTGEGEDKA